MKYEHGRRREKKGLRKKVLSSSRDMYLLPPHPHPNPPISLPFFMHTKKRAFFIIVCVLTCSLDPLCLALGMWVGSPQ